MHNANLYAILFLQLKMNKVMENNPAENTKNEIRSKLGEVSTQLRTNSLFNNV